MMKTCSLCKIEKGLDNFYCRPDRKSGYQSRCKECQKPRRQLGSKKLNEKRKIERKDPKARAKYLIIDSRHGDTRSGRQNDLDHDFVNTMLSKSCFYCGDDEIRKTLDRIDNSIGHVKTNVVTSCMRCNFTRRDMPYKAWLEIAKAVKYCRENELFGQWTGSIHD